MKFGKNLAHLSIPEWKLYNLDYNDLKTHIRDATQSSSPDLKALYRLFLKNFDNLNLFVGTKSGELSRKLADHRSHFRKLRTESTSVVAQLNSLNTLHYSIINDDSIEIKKLNKFILVQKIAVKKILKKFLKHYPDKELAQRFADSLTYTLQSNPSSFVRFDSAELTDRLLFILSEIDIAIKDLHESLLRKGTTTSGRLIKSQSLVTIESTKNSTISGYSPPDEYLPQLNVSIDQFAKFDLITFLKKNFAVHSLIPDDVASINDFYLSTDVYLNIPKVGISRLVSIIYMSSEPVNQDYSLIVTYKGLPNSLIVAITGGLRKYSYCCVPMAIAELILGYLTSDNEISKASCKKKIDHYLSHDSTPLATRMSIKSLMSDSIKPVFRKQLDRAQYFLHKDASCLDEPSPASSDNESVVAFSTENRNSLLVDTRVYEDSYYMSLDTNIYTSHDVTSRITFSTEKMDPFPFNSFSIYSNDSKLHAFETTLTSEVQDNLLCTKFKQVSLKKLPLKIQNLLKVSSVHPFKNFSIYDYMRSCYCNYIPEEENNHYSKLLNINLLKYYEDVQHVQNQSMVEGSIIQDKTRTILKRQMSYKSLRASENQFSRNGDSCSYLDLNERSNFGLQDYNPYENAFEQHLKKFTDLENYNEEENEDTYIMYITNNDCLQDNFLNRLVLGFIKFKYRMKDALRTSGSSNRAYSEEVTHKLNLVRVNQEQVYDSINDDPTFFSTSNDYQIQLQADYDYVVSWLYFTLCFNSIFISGVNIGIVVSLLQLESENTKFEILDNPVVVLLLFFGFSLALLFSMASISLNIHRFEASSFRHSGIIWSGFIVVIITVLWSADVLTPINIY